MPLKREGFLTRDARMVERKKAGLHKAARRRNSPSARRRAWRARLLRHGRRARVVGTRPHPRAGRAARPRGDVWAGGGRRLRRARHARLGPGARAGVRARRRVGGRQCRPRGCAAHACGRAPRARPRRRHLRLAQPARVQRGQALRRRRAKLTDRPRRRSRRSSTPPARGRARSTARASPPTATSSTSSSDSAPNSAGLRIAVDCANGAYSGIAPEAFERLGAEVPRRRRARRDEHQRRLRRHRPLALQESSRTAATTSASPSTATATACWRSTPRARPSTATRSRDPGARSRRRARRGHVDDEPRLPPADGRARDRRSSRPTSATATCSRRSRARASKLGGEQSGHLI